MDLGAFRKKFFSQAAKMAMNPVKTVSDAATKGTGALMKYGIDIAKKKDQQFKDRGMKYAYIKQKSKKPEASISNKEVDSVDTESPEYKKWLDRATR
jgi:hypothetical protein